MEAAEILLTTEFKPFFELQKTRYEYKLKELNVFIDDIKDFGSCIEVEILTDPGDETNAKEKIMEFLAGLEITQKDVVPKSVTNIVMKERAFKSPVTIV
ncbi:MAG: CYTH domain-containing protein [bacterium]|nr:CYTH domain-containing protein [bacterium]